MIDLLINRHTRLPIVAKPAGSVWGRRELDGPNLCVVQMTGEGAELAARLAASGVIANPFAEYATDPATDEPVMIRQSAIRVPVADVRQGAVVRAADMEI